MALGTFKSNAQTLKVSSDNDMPWFVVSNLGNVPWEYYCSFTRQFPTWLLCNSLEIVLHTFHFCLVGERRTPAIKYNKDAYTLAIGTEQRLCPDLLGGFPTYAEHVECVHGKPEHAWCQLLSIETREQAVSTPRHKREIPNLVRFLGHVRD